MNPRTPLSCCFPVGRNWFGQVWFLFLSIIVTMAAQSGSNSKEARQAETRKRFADRQAAVVAEPFVGLTTKEGKQTGLFPIKTTGVSTNELVTTAKAFLDSLTDAQRTRTVFPVEDSEWRKWCNVDNGIFVRQGVSLKEMDAPQRKAARELMRATLSSKGLALTDAIRRTDQTLRELNGDDPSFDEDLYFFTVMGGPSANAPWGWQIDGHHLVINTFVLGDQVTMTPAFWGGEPVHTTTGKYAGNVILQDEQNAGLAFMRALEPVQQAAAQIDAKKVRNNIQAEAFRDNAVLDYAGLAGTKLTPGQKQRLLALVAMFVNNQSEGQARVHLDDVAAHLEETWFAWVGGTEENAVFYYRIHSPVILIEFDHQQPVGTTTLNERGKVTHEHIHVIVRTPNGNDYGKDLLRQHLEQHHHEPK